MRVSTIGSRGVVTAADEDFLKLPAGSVQVLENDRIYSVAGMVVAVGVSPTVVLAARQRPQPAIASPLREQLVGYLVGRGAEVVRTDIRFPLDWQKFGTLTSTIRFWLNHFLEEGWKRRLFITLPTRVGFPIALPLSVGADAAIEFWQEVLILMNALSLDDPNATTTFRPNLWEVARAWEQHWNETVRHAARNSDVRPEDWQAVRETDRAWARVVQEHLEPFGYRIQSETTARLL